MKHGNIKNLSVCSQLVNEKPRDLQSHRHTKNSLFWKEARYLTKQKHLIVYVLWETKKTIKLFNQRNIDRLRTVLHRFEGFWSNFTWQITSCLVPYPITLRPRQCFWPCISLLNQCKLVIASLHLFTCTQNLMKVCFRIRMSTVTKKSSLGKQLTFYNATFGFSAKWLLRKEHGIPNRWRIIFRSGKCFWLAEANVSQIWVMSSWLGNKWWLFQNVSYKHFPGG